MKRLLHSIGRLFVVSVGIWGLCFSLANPAFALEVSLASLQGGQVHVVGKGAASNVSILWEGVQVTNATGGGTFNFTTAEVPATCVGEISDGTAALYIAVTGCTAPGFVVPGTLALVPATGQTTSFAAGDDGDLEKGIPWPNPRFTDNGDGTITDNLTTLIWLKNANCPAAALHWQQALDFVAGINSGINNCADTSNAGSHQADWRLPNIRELQSLLDYGHKNPTLPPGHPFLDFRSAFYWTSTNGNVVADGVYVVYFGSGLVGGGSKVLIRGGDILYVIAVRGGF